MRQDEIEKIMAARQQVIDYRGQGTGDGAPIPYNLSPETCSPFRSIQDLWARAGVQLATLEKLAAADAFRSLGLDRRQALWEVKALGAAKPLPLFEVASFSSPRTRGEGRGPDPQVRAEGEGQPQALSLVVAPHLPTKIRRSAPGGHPLPASGERETHIPCPLNRPL